MKYAGMPMGMWMLFAGSFQKQLTSVLGYDAATARAITKKAKPQYRQIIRLVFPASFGYIRSATQGAWSLSTKGLP